jgi:DNA gyrase subunit A
MDTKQTPDKQLQLGKVQVVSIIEEMQKSYLDYAMTVIVSRALPDVRDGLKPVQRRIIYAMYASGYLHSHRYEKSAATVGEVLKNYHPHGDIPVYDAMVRMAQDFSVRYPLIDGQGNFGSVDGDSPAAMRYTEARLMLIAEEMLRDIDKNTVPFRPNYSGTTEEPSVLPTVLPALLLNGASGIAVGMATNIPPHNIGEVSDAVLYVIDSIIKKSQKKKTATVVESKNDGEKAEEGVVLDPVVGEIKADDHADDNVKSGIEFDSDVTVDDLMTFIQGPDFPTAGFIYDKAEIANAYITGKGRVVMRAKADIEEVKGGKFAIIITQLPYQVNKATLIARIADLHKEKKIEGISVLQDESDRDGMRIYIELKRDANPKSVLNNLFKHTAMQSTFNVNMVALSDTGVPKLMNLKMILESFVKHRFVVITKRSEFELEQARAKAHVLEGLLIAVDHIDEVIKIIRQSADAEEARTRLMERFKLSEIQSTAILDMQLRKLAALERKRLEDEYAVLKETIEYLLDLLSSPSKILGVVKQEIKKLREKFSDERRTKVYKSKVGEFSEEDLVTNEPTIVTVTQSGYIKRQGMNTFRTQTRGGRGVSGITTKEEDVVSHIFACNTHDNIMFFSNKGKVFQIRVFEIPESSRVAKGQALVNLINIEQGEHITAILTAAAHSVGKGKVAIQIGESDSTLSSEDAAAETEAEIMARSAAKSPETKFLVMGTKDGTVKKTLISEFTNIRKSGLIAIKLNSGDELRFVKPSTGDDHMLLVTTEGLSINFKEGEVRETARDTAGVRGIKLKQSDHLVGMIVYRDDTLRVCTVMSKGLGKMTPVSDWPLQARGGQGVKAANVTDKTGKIIASHLVRPMHDSLVLTSLKGVVIKIDIKSVPTLGRQTQGVILMRLSSSTDGVAAATVL